MPQLSARTTLLSAVFTTLALFGHAEPQHKAWDYPPFGASDDAMKQAFGKSCEKFEGMPSGKYLHSNKLFGTAGQWQQICSEGMKKSPEELKEFFKERLVKVGMPTTTGKFTGYYRPVLEGSRTRTKDYRYPVVARPNDLIVCNGKTGQKLTKPDENGKTCREAYPTRGEIEKNISRYKPIVWLKDPVAAFFMHIQGSGVVELPDGSTINLGFAAKNGHPYVAIGKVLKERGAISAPITADKIRAWLKTHPAEADGVLHSNPSFIFFYESKVETTGAMGVHLTAGRSIAVDKDSVPLGVPMFIETTNTHDNTPWKRIMFAQDVGSAIQGPNRADIYFGQGDEAGDRAGDQNASGQMYAMVPKENLAIANRALPSDQNIAEVSSDIPTKSAKAETRKDTRIAMAGDDETAIPEAEMLTGSDGTTFLIRRPEDELAENQTTTTPATDTTQARVEKEATTPTPLTQQELLQLASASLPPQNMIQRTFISEPASVEPASGPEKTSETPKNAENRGEFRQPLTFNE